MASVGTYSLNPLLRGDSSIQVDLIMYIGIFGSGQPSEHVIHALNITLMAERVTRGILEI